MNALPEPRPNLTAGQRYPHPTHESLEEAIREAAAAVAADLPPTSYRDERRLPETGDAPPQAQPGRAPMSQKASDASGLMLSAAVSSVMVGGAVSLVLWASGHADPTVIALVFGAPTTLALAIARVFKRAGDAAESRRDIHQHFHGPVTQDHSTHQSKTIGVFAKTNNPKEKK